MAQEIAASQSKISLGSAGSDLPHASIGADHAGHGTTGYWALFIGCVGVVYGDIGTSPLYAFREALAAAAGHGGKPTREMVLGVISLILWSLILIVTVKYVLVLLRADDRGEGGIMTLSALAQRSLKARTAIIGILGMAGAALFYGDAIITPAISVLSAVEGLKLVTPVFEPYILPITLVNLIALFAVQSRGTAHVAKFFGPIMLLWFVTIAIAGVFHIFDDIGIFWAFNPYYGVVFLANNGTIGLLTLGAVFLAVTGGEALYADLGHFGRKPIAGAWFSVVVPALMLNYLGQGAMVLAHPETIENPFFLLVPSWALLPLVILATLATIIASQAVITGAFSLTRQAVQLGLLPRMSVQHTSAEQAGQIYMPFVNWVLLFGVLILVLTFKTSSNLASAYGIAVTGTMVITATLTIVVLRYQWRWSVISTALVMGPLLAIDFVFLGANLMKVHEGGWVPLLLGVCVLFVMLTWIKGSKILTAKTRRIEVPLADLLRSLEKRPPHKVSGTAVFLTSDPTYAPTALLHNLKHNKVLHEKNVLLSIINVDAPRVNPDTRVSIESISDMFSKVSVRFGYMESPNVPRALSICKKMGLPVDMMTTSFFLSRRHLKASGKLGMPLWQDHMFIAMAVNANSASDYFHLPSGRVVEVGTQVTI
ncbi:MAG: potassium transporter Kup [Alphaproteobacteria bacterium]